MHAPKLPDALVGMFTLGEGHIYVWDGKYSNGYHNHAFFVTTPDGKTTLLQPKLITEWYENVSHLVEITPNKPYHLPNWSDPDASKSRQALGLDTTTPGTYTITGLYRETTPPSADLPNSPLWTGSLATNTLTIEVTKPNP